MIKSRIPVACAVVIIAIGLFVYFDRLADNDKTAGLKEYADKNSEMPPTYPEDYELPDNIVPDNAIIEKADGIIPDDVIEETDGVMNDKDKEGCRDLCGDGVCQEIVCMAIGCPCAETPKTCPQDCE